MTIKIRKMIGDIPAVRVTDGEGSWLFELKTDGRVSWMRPDKMDEAIDIFFESLNVPEYAQDDLRIALKSAKLTLEQVEIALHGNERRTSD